jgi:Chromate transporter
MPAADEPGRGPVPPGEPRAGYQAGLATVLREWGRIGCVGFGGPPAHIALLRKLCVDREHWLDATEFEDAISACNLLPGPASTQLAIFCAWRVRGRAAAAPGISARCAATPTPRPSSTAPAPPPSARSSARPSRSSRP